MSVEELHNETFEIKDSVNPVTLKMNVFEAIATRRSIRKFSSQDVPMELLGVILDAGRYAPSAGNIQNWRFIIVKDPGNKQKIAEASLQQLWMAEAPVYICVVSDNEKLKRFYGVRGERLYSVQNCAAAIQNMLLTTHALGLASTWVSSFDEEMISRALGLPGDIRPQGILPIGYPDEIVPAPSRYLMETLVFHEAYGRRYVNVERILENPLVFDKISQMISGFVEKSKAAMQKIKEKKK